MSEIEQFDGRSRERRGECSEETRYFVSRRLCRRRPTADVCACDRCTYVVRSTCVVAVDLVVLQIAAARSLRALRSLMSTPYGRIRHAFPGMDRNHVDQWSGGLRPELAHVRERVPDEQDHRHKGEDPPARHVSTHLQAATPIVVTARAGARRRFSTQSFLQGPYPEHACQGGAMSQRARVPLSARQPRGDSRRYTRARSRHA